MRAIVNSNRGLVLDSSTGRALLDVDRFLPADERSSISVTFSGITVCACQTCGIRSVATEFDATTVNTTFCVPFTNISGVYGLVFQKSTLDKTARMYTNTDCTGTILGQGAHILQVLIGSCGLRVQLYAPTIFGPVVRLFDYTSLAAPCVPATVDNDIVVCSCTGITTSDNAYLGYGGTVTVSGPVCSC